GAPEEQTAARTADPAQASKASRSATGAAGADFGGISPWLTRRISLLQRSEWDWRLSFGASSLIANPPAGAVPWWHAWQYECRYFCASSNVNSAGWALRIMGRARTAK